LEKYSRKILERKAKVSGKIEEIYFRDRYLESDGKSN